MKTLFWLKKNNFWCWIYYYLLESHLAAWICTVIYVEYFDNSLKILFGRISV